LPPTGLPGHRCRSGVGIMDCHDRKASKSSSTCSTLADSMDNWDVNAEEDIADLWRRQVTDVSTATSGCMFADPSQTLVFLDFDDTLFPTTHLKNCKQFSGVDPWEQPEDVFEELEPWRTSVYQYLSMACSLTERCVIVTNSRRPWVSKCVKTFFPELWMLIKSKEASGRLAIIYAQENFNKKRERDSQRRFVPARDILPDSADHREYLMAAKLYAMKREAQHFYSQYKWQTWKNIISLGDMEMEHDAVQELTWRRVGPAREKVRTKAIMLPRQPTVSELTLRLRLSLTLLPVYVRFNGDIDINLQDTNHPLAALAQALGIPQMANLDFPLHAWGLAEEPSEQEAQQALDDLAIVVHEHLLAEGDSLTSLI